MMKTPAPNVGQGLQLQEIPFLQLLEIPLQFILWIAGSTHEELHVVEDRLHPGAKFFLDITRQITEVAPHRENGTTGDQPLVGILFQGLFQPGGQSQEGLPGAGDPDETHQLDRRIHQEFKGELLFLVQWADPPHPARIFSQRFQDFFVGMKTGQGGMGRGIPIEKMDKLVG